MRQGDDPLQPLSALATMGEMIMDHARIDKTPVSDEAFEELYQSTLY